MNFLEAHRTWKARIKIALLAVLYASTIGVDTFTRLRRWYFPPPVPTTYYVRNGGNAGCAGTTNADSIGPGTACAFSSIQQAINTATFGDTIKLHAGQTFDTFGQFDSFNLTDKGTPPTGTDADYITITSDDPSGTPAALSNYPAQDVRITTSMAVGMPRVRTIGSFPVFWVNPGAKYWKVERLNLTSVVGSGTIRLVGNGEPEPASLSRWPDHIFFQLNWLHPPEEDGSPLSSANVVRSAQNAFYLEATNLTIQQNSLQGFVGHDTDGSRLTSAGILMSTWADNVQITNNLIEAWTYGVFFGGGSGGIPDPAQVATVSSCGSTSCVFTNTNGLAVGEPVAVLVYSFVDGGGTPRDIWGTAYVQSIVGSTVNFAAPLCNSNNTGGNGNSCKPFDSNNLRQIPADGSRAQWEGYQVQNVSVRRNIFAHRAEWGSLMNSNCGGKGYLELKSCHNCVFNGNIFRGCTGPTVTTRNQGGSDPWNDLDGLTFSNNYWENANSPFTAYLNDGGNLTSHTQNVTFENNLVVGEFVNPDGFEYFTVVSNNFAGGMNVTIRHNTVLVGHYRSFISAADEPSRTTGLILRDNIFLAAPNACYSDGSGVSGAPITSCWPGAIVNKNVLIKTADWTVDEISGTWLTPFPGNSLAASVTAVGFRNPASLGVGGDYRLRTDSPYRNAATDGTDPGVSYPQLVAALGFDPFGSVGAARVSGKVILSGKVRTGP